MSRKDYLPGSKKIVWPCRLGETLLKPKGGPIKKYGQRIGETFLKSKDPSNGMVTDEAASAVQTDSSSDPNGVLPRFKNSLFWFEHRSKLQLFKTGRNWSKRYRKKKDAVRRWISNLALHPNMWLQLKLAVATLYGSDTYTVGPLNKSGLRWTSVVVAPAQRAIIILYPYRWISADLAISIATFIAYSKALMASEWVVLLRFYCMSSRVWYLIDIHLLLFGHEKRKKGWIYSRALQ